MKEPSLGHVVEGRRQLLERLRAGELEYRYSLKRLGKDLGLPARSVWREHGCKLFEQFQIDVGFELVDGCVRCAALIDKSAVRVPECAELKRAERPVIVVPPYEPADNESRQRDARQGGTLGARQMHAVRRRTVLLKQGLGNAAEWAVWLVGSNRRSIEARRDAIVDGVTIQSWGNPSV